MEINFTPLCTDTSKALIVMWQRRWKECRMKTSLSKIWRSLTCQKGLAQPQKMKISRTEKKSTHWYHTSLLNRLYRILLIRRPCVEEDPDFAKNWEQPNCPTRSRQNINARTQSEDNTQYPIVTVVSSLTRLLCVREYEDGSRILFTFSFVYPRLPTLSWNGVSAVRCSSRHTVQTVLAAWVAHSLQQMQSMGHVLNRSLEVDRRIQCLVASKIKYEYRESVILQSALVG